MVFVEVFVISAKWHTGANVTPNLEPRLAPTPHKLEPRSPSWKQNSPKTLQLGAKMAPRPLTWIQIGPPTWSQNGPKTPQPGAKMDPRPSILEPKWPQDPQLGLKMVPRPPTYSQLPPYYPQLGPKTPKMPNLASI